MYVKGLARVIAPFSWSQSVLRLLCVKSQQIDPERLIEEEVRGGIHETQMYEIMSHNMTTAQIIYDGICIEICKIHDSLSLSSSHSYLQLLSSGRNTQTLWVNFTEMKLRSGPSVTVLLHEVSPIAYCCCTVAFLGRRHVVPVAQTLPFFAVPVDPQQAEEEEEEGETEGGAAGGGTTTQSGTKRYGDFPQKSAFRGDL